MVYPSPIFSPPDIVEALVEEKCTALHGVPTHFLGVLSEVDERRKHGQPLNLTRLRWVTHVLLLNCTQLGSRTGVAAGSPIPIDLMKQLREKMHLTDLTNAYGMSRSFALTVLDLADLVFGR